jgi:hypothetical protein
VGDQYKPPPPPYPLPPDWYARYLTKIVALSTARRGLERDAPAYAYSSSWYTRECQMAKPLESIDKPAADIIWQTLSEDAAEKSTSNNKIWKFIAALEDNIRSLNGTEVDFTKIVEDYNPKYTLTFRSGTRTLLSGAELWRRAGALATTGFSLMANPSSNCSKGTGDLAAAGTIVVAADKFLDEGSNQLESITWPSGLL